MTDTTTLQQEASRPAEGLRNPGRCDWCQRLGERTRNRGEDLCDSCIASDMATNGVDILIRDTWRNISFTYNTVDDADKVYPSNPDGIDGRDLPGPRRSRAKLNRHRTTDYHEEG